MAGLVEGDVGLQMTLADQQPLQAVDRVIQALSGLAQQATKTGQIADQMMNHLGNTSEAVQGIRQVMEAEKAEADAARKSAAEHQHHHEMLMKEQQALNDMKQGLMQVAAASTAVALALRAMANTTIEAFKQEQSAMMGLEAVSTRTIGSFGAAKQAAEDLASDGLMSVVEASKAIQAGLATGYDLEHTINLIKTFKDSAAFNRQTGLEFGESIVRAMEGIRMGNSVLSDSAGITKNLSMILKEAGFSEQDLAKTSSDAAVRHALYNGILREAVIFQGNAAKAADTLAGAESRGATAAFQAKAAFGEALAPALQAAQGAMVPLLRSSESWVKSNPELARGLFLVAGGAVVFTGALTGLTVAVLAFNAALGPVGLLITGIGLAAGAAAGYTANVAASGQAAEKNKAQLTQLVAEYDRARKAVDDVTASEEDHQKASNDLRTAIEKIKAIQPDLVSGWDLNREALRKHNEMLDAAIKRYDMLKGAASWLWENTHVLDPFLGQNPKSELEDAKANLASLQHQWDTNPQQAVRDKLLPQIQAAVLKLLSLTPSQSSDPDFLVPGRKYGLNLAPDTRKGDDKKTGGDTGGGKEMSAELTLAMEGLQDLQAMEKTPENLRATLEKVREIIKTHQAELVKLGKDRDLIRLRDITLPQDILQADFQAALQGLNAKEQLKEIKPEDLKSALEEIRTKFADYLKAHPDEDLQLQLRIKGASEDDLKAPLEAWQKTFQQSESMGLFNGLEQFKLSSLREGLSLAIGAKDADAIAQITGQIRQLEQSMQQANFEAKFDRIAKAREQAFAGAAGQLADLNKQLIDEQAKGDKADPEKVKSIQQQMLDAVRPALEAQKTALEDLLKSETLTAEQRAQVEQQLNSVKSELYDQDVQAHRYAAEAKTAADRAASEQKQKAIQKEQEWIRSLAEADLAAIRARNEADEKAQQSHINSLQGELRALERLWDMQDRLAKQKDLKSELAAVKADTRFLKVDENGNQVYTYDEEKAREIEKQIADAEKEDQRAKRREQLQDQITSAQAELEAMRTSHQNELAERQTFWNWVEGLDLSKYAELTDAASKGMGEWAKALNGVLDQAKKDAETRAKEIKSILEGITNFSPPGVSLAAPTLPASLAASVGGGAPVVTVQQSISVSGVSNPQEAAAAVRSAASQGTQEGVLDGLTRSGRAAVRAGLQT